MEVIAYILGGIAIAVLFFTILVQAIARGVAQGIERYMALHANDQDNNQE